MLRLRKKWLNSSRIQNKQEWSTRQWQESKEVLCTYLPIITLLSEKRLQWYSPLFNWLSGFSSHIIKNQNQNPSWSQFFPILLVCFSLGGKFIFIDNCFGINETDRILNCGQRYESEHDPRSWMNNLSSWKRTWKIQVWAGIEPWPLRWLDSTHNDLSPVGLVSSIDNLI